MACFYAALFFPLDVFDEIWDLIESISEGFPTNHCPTPTVFSVPFSCATTHLNCIYNLVVEVPNGMARTRFAWILYFR